MDDMFDFRSTVPDIFQEMSLQCGFSEYDSPDMFLNSSGDFGFGSSSWNWEDYFQDIGDLFRSDPLVAI
uniref:Uncharacterized protein n=1 Tax=Rhizophora mucronata TaxID=61149 RepID=A0A2P2QTN8_RHIMU